MNKSNLIEDSATQIWNLIEKRLEAWRSWYIVNVLKTEGNKLVWLQKK
jgi:hypothetical protein